MKTIAKLVPGWLALALVAGCDAPDPIDPVAAAHAAPSAPVTQAAPVDPILVTLSPASGSGVSGHLTVSRTYGGLRFLGRVQGLAPNHEHAFHVHEVGDCSAPDASSAGEHYNPSGALHGSPQGGMHHAGDLPNLRADADGEIAVDVVGRNLELGSGHSADIAGRAIVLHAQPDDYTTQPAGASGDRIACGVIGPLPRP